MPAVTLTPLRLLLPWAIALCGAMAIADLSDWIDLDAPNGMLKPLTTLLIVVYAASLPSEHPVRRRKVLTGLVFSLLGECFMTRPEGFAGGLACFIVAQCCYLAAVTESVGFVRPGLSHGLHLVAVVWALAMWSSRPLSTYVFIVGFMVLLGWVSAQADGWWWRARGTAEEPAARCAALGGLFWMGADLLWTYSQNVARLPAVYLFVLTLYWLAQWHFAGIIGCRDEPISVRRARSTGRTEAG